MEGSSARSAGDLFFYIRALVLRDPPVLQLPPWIQQAGSASGALSLRYLSLAPSPRRGVPCIRSHIVRNSYTTEGSSSISEFIYHSTLDIIILLLLVFMLYIHPY